MADADLLAAVDLGGTKILTLIVDRDLRVAGRDERPTEAAMGPEGVVARIAESIRAAAEGRALAGAGVSTAGPSMPDKGIVTASPNLPGWDGFPLARRVAEETGLRAWIENDANCAALAEHRLGAGRGADHVVLVAAGTGIGGGLILNGRLYRGASGGAGEVGHMRLVDDGPLCGCGRHGCLEALASGAALARVGGEIAVREPGGIVARLAREEGQAPSARTIAAAVAAGDTSAVGAVHDAAIYLGAGLTNIANVFNPEVIAVAGSLRKLRGYLSVAIGVVEREAYRQAWRDVRIVETELGDEGAALGAALIAIERLYGEPATH